MSITNSNVFVVGAGGIGCELLKNLALTGFQNIHLIDLDTIEVSNLNRQFLFQKSHVGLSKALVARESILKYRPDINIIAYHDTINNPKFDVPFFRQFNLVFSALDNIAVRYHLNRMCLAANVPLIESGTSGYFGQVKPIFKGISECYDCLPRISSKTSYPSCTIRNTPSEPVHCIVWAKNLFNVLFGEPSIDNDEDQVAPELQVSSLQEQTQNNGGSKEQNGGIGDSSDWSKSKTSGVSTNQWALTHDFDPAKIAWKLYKADVEYLLGMGDLWTNRKPPIPLADELLVRMREPSTNGSEGAPSADVDAEGEQRKVWDLDKCLKMFGRAIRQLRTRMGPDGNSYLSWDKDDAVAMQFVTAAANVRSRVFGITAISSFDVKSIAGNIIPALSTTNAIVAGLIVAQACAILSGQEGRSKTLFLKSPNPERFHNSLIGVEELRKPNPKCYSCAPMPQVYLKADLGTFLVRNLIRVLIEDLFLSQPDVAVDDGKGTVLVSSEEGETTENEDKSLGHFGLGDGCRLVCDDFLQNYSLVVLLVSVPDWSDTKGPEYYELSGDVGKPILEESEGPSTSATQLPPIDQREPSVASGSLKRKSADTQTDRPRRKDDVPYEVVTGGDLMPPYSKKSRLIGPQTSNNYIPPLGADDKLPCHVDNFDGEDILEIGFVGGVVVEKEKSSATRGEEGEPFITLD